MSSDRLGEERQLSFLRIMGSPSTSAPGSFLGVRSCAWLGPGGDRRNLGLQHLRLGGKPSGDAHRIVAEESWQKQSGGRGWGVLEAVRVIPPRGLCLELNDTHLVSHSSGS